MPTSIAKRIPDDLADRSDLATRAMVSELATLDDSDQEGEEEFWEGSRNVGREFLAHCLMA
jgi:hypothetical protein